MKKHILCVATACMALLLFASCDKVSEDKYVIFSGAAGEWYDSNEDVPDTQRAFLEKYTGVRCKNCPDADEVIHNAMTKYGDRLCVASVHFNNSFGEPLYPTDPDLRTEKGNLWCDYFMGASASLPSALLNRSKSGSSWDAFDPAAGFDDRTDAILNSKAKVGIKMVCTEEDGLPCAGVYLHFAENVSQDLTLTLLVIEDDIHTGQLHGRDVIENYQQNHVLRQIVTDEWGCDVEANGKAGTKRMTRIPFSLHEECVKGNCQLIAFVSYKESREIINCCACKIL